MPLQYCPFAPAPRLDNPESGDASFYITPTVAGTLGGSEALCWQITGAGASATSGTSTGTSEISVDGSTSGNWTFTVTEWIDTNGNGQPDAGEPELQATVRVIKPVFTLTDSISGNYMSDDTNSAATPGGYLAVTQDDGTESWLQLSLTDELSPAPLPDVFTYDMESFSYTPVSSGDLPDFTAVVTPDPGQYYVSVSSTIDPNFDRYLEFDVLQFNIVWRGPAMTGVGGATEVVPGEILSKSSNTDLLTGQLMDLGYTVYQGSPIVSDSAQWNVGSLGDFVKSYTLTGAASAPTSGTVTMLAGSDLTANAVKGYCVSDSPGRTIGLSVTFTINDLYTLTFSTSTSISFQKPGQSIWQSPPGAPNPYFVTQVTVNKVKMDTDPSFPNTLVGDSFWLCPLPPLGGANGFVGTISTVQLVTGSFTYKDDNGEIIHEDTIPGYDLDGGYPYPFFGGSTGSDSPAIGADAYDQATEVDLGLSLDDWLMYTPPGPAVPVPIQTWVWWAQGSAVEAVGGGWVVTPTEPLTNVKFSVINDTSSYPQWTAVWENK